MNFDLPKLAAFLGIGTKISKYSLETTAFSNDQWFLRAYDENRYSTLRDPTFNIQIEENCEDENGN